MSWRKNTRAEAADARHFSSKWDGRSSPVRPVIPTTRTNWLARVSALAVILLAVIGMILWSAVT